MSSQHESRLMGLLAGLFLSGSDVFTLPQFQCNFNGSWSWDVCSALHHLQAYPASLQPLFKLRLVVVPNTLLLKQQLHLFLSLQGCLTPKVIPSYMDFKEAAQGSRENFMRHWQNLPSNSMISDFSLPYFPNFEAVPLVFSLGM